MWSQLTQDHRLYDHLPVEVLYKNLWEIELLLLFTASPQHCHLWLYVYNICLNLPSLFPLMNSAIPHYDHHPHWLIQRTCLTFTSLLIGAGVTTDQCWLSIQQAAEAFPKCISSVCVGFDRPDQGRHFLPVTFLALRTRSAWLRQPRGLGQVTWMGQMTYASRGRSDLLSHHPAMLLLHTDNTRVGMTSNNFLQGIPKWAILTCTQPLSQCKGGLQVFQQATWEQWGCPCPQCDAQIRGSSLSTSSASMAIDRHPPISGNPRELRPSQLQTARIFDAANGAINLWLMQLVKTAAITLMKQHSENVVS